MFLPNRVRVGNEEMAFADLVAEAYLGRVSLSSTGFYATPEIHYDRETARGRPFFYFAYGAAVSEVVIDTLTGENRLLRVDILHDVGRSLNPAVDLGQIEGGFIQGLGWLTTEELWWDEKGRLTTHAPSTYKIPTANDRPDDLRMQIWEKGVNRDADDLPLQGGRRAAADAGALRVLGADRRGRRGRRLSRLPAPRCAGDAGADPVRGRGCARSAQRRRRTDARVARTAWRKRSRAARRRCSCIWRS